jgi:hypothetical protein
MCGVMSRSRVAGPDGMSPTVDRDSVLGPNMLVVRPKQMVSVCLDKSPNCKSLVG